MSGSDVFWRGMEARPKFARHFVVLACNKSGRASFLLV